MVSNDQEEPESRQERRQKKLQKKRERMPKHGRSLGSTYRDAISKRLKVRPPDK